MAAVPPDQSCEQGFVEEFREMLRRAGLRATHSRLLVARYLAQASGLVTIGDVIRDAKHDQLDRTTVFRILRAFSRVDFVVVRHVRGREMQFEILPPLLRHHVR